MRLGVPKETAPAERRVALVPDGVRGLVESGIDVLVESHAGLEATFSDEAYGAAGASIVDTPAAFGADVVCKVQGPSADEVALLAEGSVLVGLLAPLTSPELTRALAERHVTGFSLDAVPRITRSQSMDALSSQSTVSGYKAVLLAAASLGKFFPMLTTAAGTIRPARVLVLGAGVAGLQAIATARRLGAVVSAFDVRPVVREQVESLGATFLELEVAGEETAGGYAQALDEEQHRREQELVASAATEADCVITTALIPGRPAPILLTRAAVRGMQPGSVVVDLAAETGGNVEGSVAGEVVRMGHAQVWGGRNVPSQMPGPASRLYAQNIVNLLTLMTAASEEGGRFAPDFDDEIVAGACVTHDGQIRHEPTREALEGPAVPSGPPATPTTGEPTA
jgi:H+-translocating NAD(P) transhydrogenase subunit alpha